MKKETDRMKERIGNGANAINYSDELLLIINT